MRKVFIIAYILFSAVFLSACMKDISEKEAEEKCKVYIEALREGDAKVLYDAIKLNGKAKLGEEEFSSILNGTLAKIGTFKESTSQEFKEQDGKYVLSADDEFTYRKTKTMIVLDKKGSLINAYYVLGEIVPYSGDDFTETPMQLENNGAIMQGALVIPKNFNKENVVLLIQGSGAQDMDETIGTGGNKPFKDIAYKLAKKGIASYRYDKRYINNAPSEYTVEEEITDDAKKAIELLKKSNKFKHINVLGHSLGAMCAPKIAAETPEVDKLVLMAGSTKKFTDLIYEQQQEYLKEVSGLRPAVIEMQLKDLKKIHEEIAKINKDSKGNYLSMPAQYIYSINNIDTVKNAQKIKNSMLILQGSNDFQVKKGELELWKEALKDKKNVEFRLFEGLDHLFMPQKSKEKDAKIYNVKSEVSDEVIDCIADFINKK